MTVARGPIMCSSVSKHGNTAQTPTAMLMSNSTVRLCLASNMLLNRADEGALVCRPRTDLAKLALWSRARRKGVPERVGAAAGERVGAAAGERIGAAAGARSGGRDPGAVGPQISRGHARWCRHCRGEQESLEAAKVGPGEREARTEYTCQCMLDTYTTKQSKNIRL